MKNNLLRRGRPPGSKNKTGAKKVSNHTIINMAALGLPNTEIAKAVGLTPQRISQVKNSEFGIEKIESVNTAVYNQVVDTRIEVQERISELAPKALDTVEEIMEDSSVSAATRLKAAVHVLGVAGHTVDRNVSLKALHASLPSETVQALLDNAMNAFRDANCPPLPEIIDVN